MDIHVNWMVLFIGFVTGIGQNQYFGWNFTPKSDAELITDCIIMVIYALAFLPVGVNK